MKLTAYIDCCIHGNRLKWFIEKCCNCCSRLQWKTSNPTQIVEILEAEHNAKFVHRIYSALTQILTHYKSCIFCFLGVQTSNDFLHFTGSLLAPFMTHPLIHGWWIEQCDIFLETSPKCVEIILIFPLNKIKNS